MSYRLKIQTVLLLCLFSHWAVAEDRQFQVEVIVFTQNAPNTELFEQTETELEAVKQYADVEPGGKSLQNTYNRLRKSGGYHPVYYESWQVIVGSDQLSLPIEISAPEQGLNGWVKIQRGNLLYVLADLELSSSDVIEAEAEEETLIYRLTEKRRVLLDEVHYLDHPVFGVIVKVSSVESGVLGVR